MPKGQKRLRNIPILHDEVKRTRSVKLTDTCWRLILETAHNQGISGSEMIEQWGRQLKHGLRLPPTPEERA